MTVRATSTQRQERFTLAEISILPMPKDSNVDLNRLPRHVAIIMDGNGRWAEKRHQPRLFGHKTGAESVRIVVETARELGIKVLTLYAFSSENWNRPETEVSGLMSILKKLKC